MNVPRLRNSLSIMTTGLVLMNTAWAGIPVWTFTPVLGSPASVSVSPSATATIKYTVTNQSHKSHTLKMTPIQGIASSGCTSPLGYYQSCTLTLAVAGSGLTGDVFGGPVLCDQGNPNQCYQPSSADQLRITLLKNPPVIHNTLAAVGNYSDGNKRYPMLAQSTDNGVSWSYKIDNTTATLPVDYDRSGDFYNTSCTGTTCTAAGLYLDSSNKQYPMLAQSTDNGLSWTYKIDKTAVTLPVDYGDFGTFYSTSCTGSSCMAAGNYFDGNKRYPMLAQSTDNGMSWTYKIDKTAATLPVDYGNFGRFDSSSCTGTTCTAVGSYSDVNNINYPMLAQSTDNGVSWTYKIDKTTGTLPVDFRSGNFTRTSCTGTTCTVVGAYFDNDSNVYPMLAQSTDNGVSWTYKLDKTTGTLPLDYDNNGNFNSTSCTGNTCTVVGNYYDGIKTYPMLAQSTDNGVSWTYKIDKTTGTLPLDYGNNGRFTSTSCTGTTCTAAGFYYDNNSRIYPMLAQSTDNGVSWTYKIDKTAATLPVDFSGNGNFNSTSYTSTSCTGNTCTAAGHYTDSSFTVYPMLAQSVDNGVSWIYMIDKTAGTLPVDFANFGTFNSTSATNTLLKSLGVVNPAFERGAPRPPFRVLD